MMKTPVIYVFLFLSVISATFVGNVGIALDLDKRLKPKGLYWTTVIGLSTSLVGFWLLIPIVGVASAAQLAGQLLIAFVPLGGIFWGLHQVDLWLERKKQQILGTNTPSGN